MSVKNKKLIRIDKNLLRDHQKVDRDFFIEHDNVYELFKAQVKKHPQKCFIIFPEYHQMFSYQDLNREIVRRAGYLKTQNLNKGDRIGLVFSTSPDFVVFYLAAFSLGIVVVPINPDLAPPEISYIVADSQARAVFYQDSFSEKIFEVQKIIGRGLVIFKNVAEISIAKVAEEDISLSDVKYTDEAVIIYTSGTTGKPKGVILSHLNLLADARVISEWFQFTSDTRTLCLLPLFHNNGLVITLLAPLSTGGSTVMVPSKTSLRSFWSFVKGYSINWTSVMPSILAILLSLKLERKDSSMVGIICGGQVLTREVKNQFENRFRVPIFEGYGMTEAVSYATFNEFPVNHKKPETVGRALPSNNVAIFDENDREVGPGKVGEICMRGLNIMTEYLGLDEVNKKSLRGGWLHSGDYGYLDADGYLYFKTRKDYLIIKGGENIYPSEIENVLFGHPAVEECAVVGVPDKLLGQDIVAFAKLNRSCAESDLKNFLSGKLAYYKYPKKIIIINELTDLEELPKGPTKKILYRLLLNYYNEHLNYD